MNLVDYKKLSIDGIELKDLSINGTLVWKAETFTNQVPSEYQEVAYICNQIVSTTAGSYLDLGFAFDEACTFYINYVPNISSSTYIFGAAENSGVLRCMITDQTANTLLYGSSGSGTISVGAAKYNTEKSLKCELKKGLIKITDLLTNTSAQLTTQGAYTMTNNLYLFAQNYNGSARIANNTNLKSFSYYDKNDTLICDLVPCYRKKDGVIGMYDKARQIFLTNAGSQSFVAGGEVGAFTNQVPISIDADGSIFNGVGYKENVRLSSSGGISSSAQNGSVTTGFIPFPDGDKTVIRMKGVEWLNAYANHGGHYYILFYGEKKNILTQGIFLSAGDIGSYSHVVTVTRDAKGVETITFNKDYGTGLNTWLESVRNDARFIRITAYGKGADMIVTINEEIE